MNFCTRLFNKITLFTAITCLPQLAQASVHYTLSFPEPEAHYATVSITLDERTGDSTDFKLPVWIPGSYMVREFSGNIERFAAAGNLQWKKVSKNCWRVYHPGRSAITVSYSVYCFELSVRTSFVDHDQGLINGSSVFMYTDDTRDRQCSLTVIPLVYWKKISTGLDETDGNPFRRIAENYDRLVDCPVLLGNHISFFFNVSGIPHEVAMMGKADFDSVRIKKDLAVITKACMDVFGGSPLKSYTFIVINDLTSGGGLEHATSSVLKVDRNAYSAELSYKSFLSLATHEYFHLWLVKRIKDAALVRLDYDKEMYTTQLWLYEGFTSYYDEYLLHKTGIFSREDYLKIIAKNMNACINDAGEPYQSLAEASFDAWVKYYRKNENSSNSTISYYTKGGMLALILNLDLLHRSGGQKSLDDFMKFLYSKYFLSGTTGISDKQLQSAFETVWGVPLDTLFADYIYGTVPVDYKRYFSYCGITLNEQDTAANGSGYAGITLKTDQNGVSVAGVRRGSPAWRDGLYAGDRIIKADTAAAESVAACLKTKKPGDEVIFRIERRGLITELMVTLGEDPSRNYDFGYVKKPDALQKKVLHGWLNEK
ncbi:MAG TPA: PDZ domain-containing protein [Bacteroidia bacterium]|nr:PDZ domain-containing protein [Bacteroidia bacterium]